MIEGGPLYQCCLDPSALVVDQRLSTQLGGLRADTGISRLFLYNFESSNGDPRGNNAY
jgi:hypothetical protein